MARKLKANKDPRYEACSQRNVILDSGTGFVIYSAMTQPMSKFSHLEYYSPLYLRHLPQCWHCMAACTLSEFRSTRSEYAAA